MSIWMARRDHALVKLPDGTLILMGGYNGSYLADVWKSDDGGTTWVQQNSYADWGGRSEMAAVALPDGSIVIMGGYNGSRLGDVWRSTNKGVTWTQQSADPGWSARRGASAVPDSSGNIVIMAGYDGSYKHDVWISADQGASFTQQTAAAGWSIRGYASVVRMPDGSIILMAGYKLAFYNDVWRSTDNGVNWTQQTGSASWVGRYGAMAVPLSNGNVALMGGYIGVIGSTEVYNAQCWLSTDSGATWTRVSAATESLLSCRSAGAVALADDTIVIAGGYSNAYLDTMEKSTDSGTTWSAMSPVGVIPTITGVSPNTGPTYGGTEVTITGTYLLIANITFGDDGAMIASATDTQIVAISPAHSTAETVHIVATIASGVSVTSSSDQFEYETAILRWVSADIVTTQSYIGKISDCGGGKLLAGGFDPNNHPTINISTDSGHTWNQQHVDGDVTNGSISGISSNGPVILASEDGAGYKILRWNSETSIWDTVYTGSGNLSSLTWVGGTTYLVIDAAAGLIRSTASGNTGSWSVINSEIVSGYLASDGNGTIVLVSDDGTNPIASLSTDAGDNWTLKQTVTSVNGGSGFVRYYAQATPFFLWGIGDYSTTAQIWKSLDGISWSLLGSIVDQPSIWDVGIATSSMWYAVSGNIYPYHDNLWKSTDSGVNWAHEVVQTTTSELLLQSICCISGESTAPLVGGYSSDSPTGAIYYYVPEGVPPVIARVSPTSGPESGGTPVTITGTGFAGATAVKFGTADAASFTIVNDTEITATSPDVR